MDLTTVEAARRLGVTRRRVLALIEAGRLKAVRFGCAYALKAEDVDALTVRIQGRPTKAILEIRAIAERPGNDRDAVIAREMLRQHMEERRW